MPARFTCCHLERGCSFRKVAAFRRSFIVSFPFSRSVCSRFDPW
jgi:hypothetical protein